MSLADINPIKVALKSARTEKIKLLHVLIFNDDKGRENRKDLRAFTGFPFQIDDAAFADKLTKTLADFSQIDLISIANLLHIDIHGTEQEIARRILVALTDLEAFGRTFPAPTDSEIESDLTDENNVSHRLQAPCFPPKQSISFSDIENLIPPFSGSKSDNVLTWLARFEALAESFEFSEVQKFIFVERALTP